MIKYSNFSDPVSVNLTWNLYFTTRYISNLTLLTTTATTQTITATIVGTGQEGIIFEYSTDGGANWTAKAPQVSNILNATGLTELTEYKWRARLYKGTGYSAYSNIVTGTTPESRFIITVDTTKAGSANTHFVLPCTGAGYSATVDWGDSSTTSLSGTVGDTDHTYASSGIYQIKISGTFPRLSFNGTGDCLKLKSIDNWGVTVWAGSMAGAFHGCANMEANYVDIPNFAAVTNMSYMFTDCSLFDGLVANWNTANVTNMDSAFARCSIFNHPLTNWNTEKVIRMINMFLNCVAFNSDVSSLRSTGMTGDGYALNSMFKGCTVFNQDIPDLVSSAVTHIYSMLKDCAAFNGSIANWNTSNVTSMFELFHGCINFNKSLAHFNTAKVTNMSYMLFNCNAFNGSVANFNTSLVTLMNYMFYGCSVFNQSIISFDTAKVTNMRAMFAYAYAFNQPVNHFNTANVTDMYALFDEITVFNQPVSNWNTAKVTVMLGMFQGCTVFNQSVSNFNTSLVTTMYHMFNRCASFKQDISNFNLESIADIREFVNPDINEAGTTTNYDNFLIAIASQNVPNSLVLGMGASKYSAGAAKTARDHLTGVHGWTIGDGGQA